MSRPVRWTLWTAGILTALVLLLGIAALVVFPSDWLREQVRTRMVAEIERVSGGKTEIGNFRFDWKNLTAEVAPFVLRGTEPATERPLFRAESVVVGLRVISMMKRDIDIATVRVDGPQLNILVDAEGRTNFPDPKIKRDGESNPVEQLLKLAVGRITLQNGWISYADRKIPLTLQGENLQARLDYNFNGPSYRGALKMDKLAVDTDKTEPVSFDLDTTIGLFANRLEVESAKLARGDTKITATGAMVGFKDPRFDFNVNANASVADLGAQLNIPKPHVGQLNFDGKLSYDTRERLLLAGKVQGTGLALHHAGVRVDGIVVSSDMRLTPDAVAFRDTRVNALGGTFTGTADVAEFKSINAKGRVEGLSLSALSRVAGVKSTPYSGRISGPVEVATSIGTRDLKAAGTLTISPEPGGVPVRGSIQAAYDQRRGSLELGNSQILLPSTRVDLSGTLASSLKVHLETRDLHDLTPAMSLAGQAVPDPLPVKLQQDGAAVFEGTVNGALSTARIAGALTLTNFVVRDQSIDRLVANVDANESSVHLASVALAQGKLRLEGSADAVLTRWKLNDTNPIKANLKLQGAEIERLLATAGQKLPLEGLLSATASLEGTVRNPRANVRVHVEHPVVYGEKLDRIRAEVRYAGRGVDIIDGVAELGAARILLTGAYEHAANDYKNGRLRYDVSTQSFALERIANIQRLRPGVHGRIEVKATGSADVRNGQVQPDKLDGLIGIRNLVVDGRAVGSFTVDADTAGSQLNLQLAGNLRGSQVGGKAAFQLTGDYPGTGSVEFSSITLSTLQDLALAARGTTPMPFDGFVEGKVTFSGPARKPEMMRARVELPSFQMSPVRSGLTPNQTRQLTLRNAEPMVLEYDGKSIQVRSAHMVGSETDVRLSGSFTFNDRTPLDLQVDGRLNLGIAQNFNTDVLASGAAIVNASVRGTMQEPQVVGRMELKAASFYLADIPNGLDNANGVILFDRRRATVEKLTGETGGGTISLGGFVGFGAPEVSYRLSARADNVRVRYPEGVSTTVSSNLSLTGTSSKSMLSGVVTVRRAGFNPRTDVGGILAASARPVATPLTPNLFLRGMQLDIQIETAPGLQFQTALTNDLQAEAELRVRGTAAKPTLLGRMIVNQGEVQFFGNKYSINRGEIAFYNPAKIEPVLDMDLETRVRGVLVTINFTGPLSKLNVSYRSDPPLQSTEIIALLAVGRAPGTNSSLASGQTVASQSFASTGTNTLLGQAVAAPISGRLQRFFGVSKLKIDPQLTGINAVPQARLTIEQQVSRDVTLTYITNLSQANQQIIRVEWDISRNWSVVALREETGAFGIDFFFKKRFK